MTEKTSARLKQISLRKNISWHSELNVVRDVAGIELRDTIGHIKTWSTQYSCVPNAKVY